MMSINMGAQDLQILDKFTRFFTLKVAQVVVQSRLGRRLALESVPEESTTLTPSQVHHKSVDWFNLAIPDVAEVTLEAKRVLNGEIVVALSKVFVIEISLRTDDGDEMVLELWTLKILPEGDPNMTSLTAIYYRMGIILKSTLTISRIAPAYKISRSQNSESYKISYRICSGPPDTNVLGENYKTIKISELGVVLGNIQLTLLYRTEMAITPSARRALPPENIIVKSDHFPNEQPKSHSSEKKVIDLNKPLTAGAFVDTERIAALHQELSQQLPPQPDISWLLTEKIKFETRLKRTASAGVPIKQGGSEGPGEGEGEGAASSSAPGAAHTRAVEVPAPKSRPRSESQAYSRVMDIPFADGSPIAELASFYQECLDARSRSNEWAGTVPDAHHSSDDSGDLSQKLKELEEAVPEFDSMVASMFSNSNNSDSVE